MNNTTIETILTEEGKVFLQEQAKKSPSFDWPKSFSPMRDVECDIKCSICLSFLTKPLETPCQHIYCSDCVINVFLTENKLFVNCPCCTESISCFSVKPAKLYFLNILRSLPMQCNTCMQICNSLHLNEHTCQPSQAKSNAESSSQPRQASSDILERPLELPLTPELEKMATHLLKTKLNQSADGKTAIYKTGGPKLLVVQSHQPRVSTTTASRSTIRKRSNYLQKQRDRISMGSCGTQQQDEIKIAAKQQRIDQLFARVSISSEELLAVKSDLGITWNSNRKLKRWFNHWGVRSGGEQQMRREKESIIGDNLVAKNLPFLFTEEKGRIEKLAPCVYTQTVSHGKCYNN
ncbi:E3 ubiquitin-protein ligase LNX-like [Ptychodera flava]|uniref:E3 ubiquitin-protein ligase LNX-like n=1 Tax=Ptychodera flava TaxID=63121 RepID=UPI00396A2C50